MPTFNLAPKPEDLDPQWDAKAPQTMGNGARKMTRAEENARIEAAAGPLKPVAQLMNTLASPDTKIGIFTGPVNGISKLGNAIGDLVQGKKVDVSDAWTISDKQARAINPWRIGRGQEVTPADDAGLAVGEGIGAEIAGAATGATLLQQASKIRRLQQAAQAFQQQAAVRRAAVAISVSPKLRAGANVLKNVGEAVGSTALATPFLDQEDGNLANLGDAVGLKLPGRVEPGENYLQSLAKSIAVEGVAAPLALLGMGSMIKPIREGMAKGDLGWIQQLADAELEPYLPKAMAGPALPAAGQTGLPALPGYSQQGGALVPYDSAITRSLQEQTQIRQVTEQRQRLQDMGLIQQGEGGQLDLALGGAVDPEIRLQVRQLQVQRGQLIKQGMDAGQDVTKDLAKIDQQIGDLIQAGNSADYMPGERFTQPELDMPDGRPELDTYLAQLDELSDKQLREIHSRVYADINAERNRQELGAAQQRVAELQQQLADIDTKLQEQVARDQQATDDAFNLSDEEVYAKYPGLQEWESRERELKAALSQDPKYTATIKPPGGGGQGPRSVIGGLNKAGEKELARILKAELGQYPGPQVAKRPLITPIGAKRMAGKIQKELAMAQQQLAAIEARGRVPESLVGDQLQIHLEYQQGLDLSAPLTYRQPAPAAPKPGIPTRSTDGDQLGLGIDPEMLAVNNAPLPELPPVQVVERVASEYGYRTPADYRDALNGFSRDTLRRLSMPDSSPEVAALVKARTGRRVWQAKKSDIIDALVETAQKRGRFGSEEFDQAALDLTVDDAPWKRWEPVLRFFFEDKAKVLTRKAANLNVPGMGKVLDADGNEITVPLADYTPGGTRQLSQPEAAAPRKPETAEQLSASLTTNPVGGDAPLLDQPADLTVAGMGKVLDADGNEQLAPLMDFSARGMDATTRERLKAEILQRAVDNGEVQPPVSPLPQRPVTTFEQSSLIDELFTDPTGQMSLAFSTDQLPTYKASGKNVDTLLEEMRLRFEYNLLDEQAQRAQQQALMAAHGWDTLPWEEKKKLGILDQGFYSLQRHEFGGAVDRLRQPTAQFNPELGVVPPRQPKVYTWKPGGEIVEEAPAAKAAEPAAPAKPGRKTRERQSEEARVARVQKDQAKQGLAAVEAKRQQLLKQREELTRQSQGAKC